MKHILLRIILKLLGLSAIVLAVLAIFLLIVGNLDATRNIYLIRLEPKSNEPLEAPSVNASIDILRTRIKKIGGRRIGISEGGVLTRQFSVDYMGNTRLEMLLDDQRLEIRELTDLREWRDENTALTALGGVIPTDSLIIPTSTRDTSSQRAFLVRKKILLTNCDFDAVKKKFWESPVLQVTVRFKPDALQRLGASSAITPASKFAILYDGLILRTSTLAELSEPEIELSGLTEEQLDNLVLMNRTGCTPHRFVVEKNYTIMH